MRDTHVHVPPAQFLDILERTGFSRAEAADAIGRTRSRVTELTHSKGASVVIYKQWESTLVHRAHSLGRHVRRRVAA